MSSAEGSNSHSSASELDSEIAGRGAYERAAKCGGDADSSTVTAAGGVRTSPAPVGQGAARCLGILAPGVPTE
jgi:hypothetical protein